MANRDQHQNGQKQQRQRDAHPDAGADSHLTGTLNHDGSRLGGGGGPVGNPTAEPAERELALGDPSAILAVDGQRKEELPGFSGGPGAGDRGVSGWIDSDPSGQGRGDEAGISPP